MIAVAVLIMFALVALYKPRDDPYRHAHRRQRSCGRTVPSDERVEFDQLSDIMAQRHIVTDQPMMRMRGFDHDLDLESQL